MVDVQFQPERFVQSVGRARAAVAIHPSVRKVDVPVFYKETAQLEALVEVPLPNAWRAEGSSPNGVQKFEPVRLDFPSSYPLDAPEVSLRPDFGRDLAHIQPWTTADGRPVPCIQDGQMSEFFQHQGIAGVLNQTVLWLEHAAEGTLIDPAQGWEPTRRDSLNDFVVADADALRRQVDRRGGFKSLRFFYIRHQSPGSTESLHGHIHDGAFPFNANTVRATCSEKLVADNINVGKSLAIVVWPGKHPSGEPVTCGTYAPDQVTSLGSLKVRASLFGCANELESALGWLATCVKAYTAPRSFSLAVVLCARRPFHLIGASSDIELCIYVLDFNVGVAFPRGNATPVRPVGHRDSITASLLSRMSGLDPVLQRPVWTLIGAGSLGSKIGLHMARAGRGPATIIDKSAMSPHNAARHALIPHERDIAFADAKARLLGTVLADLQQPAKPLVADVLDLLNTPAKNKEAWTKETWVIINTTASLRVRRALTVSSDNPPFRVIEMLVYAQGRLGLIATEGPSRNPNLQDLFAQFYSIGRADDDLRTALFNRVDDVVRTSVGEGCGSATMRMSDGRISLYAAGMSEYLLCRQPTTPSDADGELLIATLADNGMGVSWRRVEVPSVTTVATGDWQVRISYAACREIDCEVARYPDDETGGVLLGRHDEVTRTFHVVAILPAPEDSTRSPTEFILGTEGLRKTLDDYARSTDCALYCLGTWHSHLAPSGPSNTDRLTARAVGLARLAPSVLLIHTPGGYRALIADSYRDGEL